MCQSPLAGCIPNIAWAYDLRRHRSVRYGREHDYLVSSVDLESFDNGPVEHATAQVADTSAEDPVAGRSTQLATFAIAQAATDIYGREHDATGAAHWQWHKMKFVFALPALPQLQW